MATGSGIPQSNAIVTTDITPSYSVPHDNAIASALGNLGDAAQGFINDKLKEHYAQVGAEQGAAVAAGTAEYKKIPVITDVGRARQAAFSDAYLSGVKTDIDAHLAQAHRDNATDPVAFKAAADGIVAGFAKGAPGPYAVHVQQYAAERAAGSYNNIANDKVQRDQQTAVVAVNSRQQTLSDTKLGMAGSGQENTPEYAAATAEWNANEAAKVANPLYNYPPEKAALVAANQTEALRGAILTHHVSDVYDKAGGGEAGKAAALAEVKAAALDDNGAMSDLPKGQRLKLAAVAVANINALDKDDAERRTIQAQHDRQAHLDRIDTAGQLQLGLTDGSTTEAQVRAAEAQNLIEPGAAARIIMSGRAMARQAAAQNRMVESADRTNTYQSMMELANNGQMTNADLAANGKDLLPTQRMAVAAKIDKTIGPGVKNITGLASAAFKDGGIQGSAAKIALENLNVDAATYMKNNPASTVGQQQAFAADWVHKTKGLVVNTAMTTKAGPVKSRAQFDADYRGKFHGQTVTQGDLDAQWARYKSVNPTAK